MNLKELLKDKLTEEEMEFCPRSYEVTGHIAILEIPEELRSKEKIIGETLLNNRPNIRTVVRKSGDREGEFRLKKYKLLVGENEYDTIHLENKCRFYLNIKRVYFSPRESTERERISMIARENERILVLGCGVGPFPISIAKNKEVEIVGVDLNPDAIEYFNLNIEKNKLKGSCTAVLGDVKEYCEIHKKEFDRILITMPQQSENFITSAIESLKEYGTIHFYTTESDAGISNTMEFLKSNLEKHGKDFKIETVRKVLPYSPKASKYCFDIVIY